MLMLLSVRVECKYTTMKHNKLLGLFSIKRTIMHTGFKHCTLRKQNAVWHHNSSSHREGSRVSHQAHTRTLQQSTMYNHEHEVTTAAYDFELISSKRNKRTNLHCAVIDH